MSSLANKCALLLSSDDELETMATTFCNEDSSDCEENSRSQTALAKNREVTNRNTLEGHQRIFSDYFAEKPIYSAKKFRRTYRMKKHIFLRILKDVENHEEYFVQKRSASGKLGLSPLQKVTAAFRILTHGIRADYVDEYVIIGETTSIKSMKLFVKAIISTYGNEYLRSPNSNDISRLLAKGEQRRFPGMLRNIDCMHWKWKNYPTSWKGMFTGHVREPTIILEAVASFDLWIWHAFFGLPGSHNDINVLERSNLFADLAKGRAPEVNYSVNGHDYPMGYYLADGIYPTWSTFVKTISAPQSKKHKVFAKAQESIRKDVERAFGVLQARFAIIREPVRYFNQSTLKDIMMACVILQSSMKEIPTLGQVTLIMIA